MEVPQYLNEKTDYKQMLVHKAEIAAERSKPLTLDIKRATVLPRKNQEKSPVWGLGGVIDSSGKFVDESRYKNGWSQFGGAYDYDKGKVSCLDEDVIWGGVSIKHWGHFLIDFMTRVWYPALYDPRKKILYVANKKDVIEGNFAELLDLMGIPKERLIKVSVPTAFKSITIPEISYQKAAFYFREFTLNFNKAIINVIPSMPALAERKIYFSRLNLSEAKNKEVGEKFIENAFKEVGFEVIHPETLSVSEQIKIWNTASEIACLNGTIPLNIPLCNNKNLKLIVLNKSSRLHENLLWFEAVFDFSITYVDVYDPLLTKGERSLGKGPFIMFVTKELCSYFSDNHSPIKPTTFHNILFTRIKFFSLVLTGTIMKAKNKLRSLKNKISRVVS